MFRACFFKVLLVNGDSGKTVSQILSLFFSQEEHMHLNKGISIFILQFCSPRHSLVLNLTFLHTVAKASSF